MLFRSGGGAGGGGGGGGIGGGVVDGGGGGGGVLAYKCLSRCHRRRGAGGGARADELQECSTLVHVAITARQQQERTDPVDSLGGCCECNNNNEHLVAQILVVKRVCFLSALVMR